MNWVGLLAVLVMGAAFILLLRLPDLVTALRTSRERVNEADEDQAIALTKPPRGDVHAELVLGMPLRDVIDRMEAPLALAVLEWAENRGAA